MTDLNLGWRDSTDYQPHRHDECTACGHRYYLHFGETYDGSDTHCTYEADDGCCECSCFEP
jgi:hypothetical protein